MPHPNNPLCEIHVANAECQRFAYAKTQNCRDSEKLRRQNSTRTVSEWSDTVSNEYRIEPAGNAFIVIDPWGERLVDTFRTRKAAQRDIERCKREDAMHETATQLVDIAIKAHMRKFGIDRKTAQFWIHGAMGG